MRRKVSKGDIVLYHDAGYGFVPAVVTNRPTEDNPLLCLVGLISGYNQCTFFKNWVSYGLKIGQWCYRWEEPEPPQPGEKPRPPHEIEEERARAAKGEPPVEPEETDDDSDDEENE